MSSRNNGHCKAKRSIAVPIIEALILVILIIFLILIILNSTKLETITSDASVSAGADVTPPVVTAEQTPVIATDEPVITETPVPVPDFDPYYTENTDPSKFIKTTAINIDGTTLEADEEYVPQYPIDFGYGDEYTQAQGIITFRGNNFRDNAAYGLAKLTEFKFSDSWNVTTGTLVHAGAVWTGSGWTGQPLIVKWPAETKAIMNMYDWAKEDDELVEVIYATMDGNVYFLDLASGKQTRDTLKLGYTFKGAGALDPRGYPILYLGAGYDSDQGTARAFIISLIDCSIMYEFGNNDSFSLRGSLSYFDSSALVDAETDQLIYPGENGILYIMKLNTQYDPGAGTLSIEPSNIIKWRYYGVRTNLSSYWVGMEDSAVIWRGHIIMCDNGGNLMCLDLNTLELDWVQNTLDDTNCSPVMSIEDGHPYIYISTSYHYGWRSWTTATVPIWKIDAENGEIVWQTDYQCYTESGVSGGVQSTIALGKNKLDGKIYVTVSKTDNASNGVLACLNTENGEVIWEHKAYYTWSSPVLVYNEDGSGYVVYCTYGNFMYLMDGETGSVMDSFNLGGGVEASPAVYENKVVVGTRQCRIWGITMS